MAYTTKSGDTWDGIAKSVYGDELKADDGRKPGVHRDLQIRFRR